MTGMSYPSGHATELLGYNIFSKKVLQWGKNCIPPQKFSIFAKMAIIWSRKPFFAKSIFSSSANVGLLMTNKVQELII